MLSNGFCITYNLFISKTHRTGLPQAKTLTYHSYVNSLHKYHIENTC